MKKKLLIALVALLVAAFTLGMTAAFADDQKPWAPADSNVTLTGGSEKVARFTGTAGVSNKVTYKDTVNLKINHKFAVKRSKTSTKELKKLKSRIKRYEETDGYLKM